VHKVHQVIHEGRQATVNNVSNIADYSEDTCQHIVTKDFNMRWVTVQFVIVCWKMSRNKTDTQPARAGSFFFNVLIITRRKCSWREKNLGIWQTFEVFTDFGRQYQETGVAKIFPTVW